MMNYVCVDRMWLGVSADHNWPHYALIGWQGDRRP